MTDLNSEAIKSNVLQTRKFCPNTNNFCRADCICFIEAKVLNGGVDVHGTKTAKTVRGAYCEHVLINAHITTEAY